MSSYFAERGGAPESGKGLTPFLKVTAGRGSKATVPTSLLTNPHFASLSPLTFSNYPEPGQSTSFTATVKDSTNHVYDITATTTYPSGDLRSKYVEEYYVMDGNPSFPALAADGVWDTNDAIVKKSGGSWVQDQAARVQQVLTFTDGTTRSETIVAQTQDWGASPSNKPKFASFDVNGSLDMSQSFVPDGSSNPPNITFSSVVVYTVTPSVTTSFPFWQGSQEQSILGIRYYTEYKDTGAHTLTETTVSFEKTVDTLTTTGGSFSTTLATVFAGSQFSTLAESVLRQQVVYQLDGSNNVILSTGAKTTHMQTRVADITSDKDFYLTQLDSDAAALGSWTTSSIYTPTGNVDELLAADPTSFAYSRTLTVSANAAPLYQQTSTATDVMGTGDLATVYTSIQEGAAAIGTGTTIPGSLQPAGVEWSYGGSQGTTIAHQAAYDLSAAGTVEAWVFLNAQTDTGGIVHKGVLPDFSDECYSLQFWGNGGQVAWVVDGTGGGSNYDLVTSSINLNTGKWYYLVGTWDTGASGKNMKLYINGTLNASVKLTKASAGAQVNGSAVIVGSQLPTTYSAQYGYFGFNGKINGVRISQTAMDAATVASNYATYVLQTPKW